MNIVRSALHCHCTKSRVNCAGIVGVKYNRSGFGGTFGAHTVDKHNGHSQRYGCSVPQGSGYLLSNELPKSLTSLRSNLSSAHESKTSCRTPSRTSTTAERATNGNSRRYGFTSTKGVGDFLLSVSSETREIRYSRRYRSTVASENEQSHRQKSPNGSDSRQYGSSANHGSDSEPSERGVSRNSRRYGFTEPRQESVAEALERAKRRLRSGTPRRHPYFALTPWVNTREAYVNHLVKNMTVREDGIIVLNKPYASPVIPQRVFDDETDESRRILTSLRVTVPSEFYYGIREVLPDIREKLGLEELHFVRAPDRYCSGVTLLCASEAMVGQLKKGLTMASHKMPPSNRYLAITLYSPNPPFKSERSGIAVEEVGEHKESVIRDQFSRTAVNKWIVNPVKVEYRVASSNRQLGVSLVHIAVSDNCRHFLRCYLAHRLSPIIGDNLFGSRVQRVMGVPVAISPHNNASQQNQRLPDAVLHCLALKKGNEHSIPTMLHLSQVEVPFGRRKHAHSVTLDAPVPEHFRWTCERLGLECPENVSTPSTDNTPSSSTTSTETTTDTDSLSTAAREREENKD